jgi:hypothetical protein
MPKPEARMATISLSAAILLNPSSTPTRTAMGTVTMKKLGSRNSTTSSTLEKVELLRTTRLRMLGSSFISRMKVNSAQPISVWERISPRM